MENNQSQENGMQDAGCFPCSVHHFRSDGPIVSITFQKLTVMLNAKDCFIMAQKQLIIAFQYVK